MGLRLCDRIFGTTHDTVSATFVALIPFDFAKSASTVNSNFFYTLYPSWTGLMLRLYGINRS